WAAASARGRVGRILGSRPLYRMGRASYDIYILQMPLMYLVLAAKLPLAGAQFVVVFGLLVYGVGLAFHLTVEPHAQKWVAQLLAGRDARATPRGATNAGGETPPSRARLRAARARS
ncbi:MAG TPA: hypothetical protein VIA18_12535, partial [Polyangia bacterium]|nr:hypothetical protein [Polyangia bacterium]